MVRTSAIPLQTHTYSHTHTETHKCIHAHTLELGNTTILPTNEWVGKEAAREDNMYTVNLRREKFLRLIAGAEAPFIGNGDGTTNLVIVYKYILI